METAKNDTEQKALWNGTAADAWIAAQAMLDGMFAPFERLLVDGVRAQAARRVLDVGCGTGATTLAVARLPVPAGEFTGVDISAPMLATARTRAAKENSRARFVCADAATHEFSPGSFDMIISRFGVMFFEDPAAAFANLRRAVTDQGRMQLIAWRGAQENPFMTAAERAAAPLLPGIPARDPRGPGQFAFADSNEVRHKLESSGWRDIELKPLDVVCSFPTAELERYVTRLGPIGKLLQGVDDATRQRVVDAVLPAFDPYLNGAEVRFDAACWMIVARAGAAS